MEVFQAVIYSLCFLINTLDGISLLYQRVYVYAKQTTYNTHM